MNKAEFIAAMTPLALACAKASGIPASFTVAQAALESGWGMSKPAVNAMNLFNVKASAPWRGRVYQMASTEVEGGKEVLQAAGWRVYSDWKGCVTDRAQFLATNPRYAGCFKETTAEGWARAVQAAGWATDPQYADKIMATIRSNNLASLDA